MLKFWTTLIIRPRFPKQPTKFWMINWPTDSDQECKRKMNLKRNKILTWKMIPIAQFALQRWTKILKRCKVAKLAKNISILNVFQHGKSTMQHVHYAEASLSLDPKIQTTLSASFMEFISKRRKMKINDFHLSIFLFIESEKKLSTFWMNKRTALAIVKFVRHREHNKKIYLQN